MNKADAIITLIFIIAAIIVIALFIDSREKRIIEKMTPEEKEKYMKQREKDNQTVRQAVIFSTIFRMINRRD